MISDIEHLFIYFGHLYVFGEMPIQSLSIFLIRLFLLFLLLSCPSSLYVVNTNPSSDIVCTIFFHSIGCLRTLIIVFLVIAILVDVK